MRDAAALRELESIKADLKQVVDDMLAHRIPMSEATTRTTELLDLLFGANNYSFYWQPNGPKYELKITLAYWLQDFPVRTPR